jgi:hypothetical protein
MASPKKCRQVKSESKLVIVHSSTTFRVFLYLIDTWDSPNWVPRTPLVNHHYPYLNGYVGQSASWQRGCKRRMSKKSVHTHSTLRHATAHVREACDFASEECKSPAALTLRRVVCLPPQMSPHPLGGQTCTCRPRSGVCWPCIVRINCCASCWPLSWLPWAHTAFRYTCGGICWSWARVCMP